MCVFESSKLSVGFSTGVVIVYKIENILSSSNPDQYNAAIPIADSDFEQKYQLHKSGVSCLSFNSNGTLLASGGQDTNFMIYDLVEGILKFVGHKESITSILFHTFYENNQPIEMVISSSKDAVIKIWDLQTKHCVQSLLDTGNKVYQTEIINDLLVIGSNDEKIRVFKLKKENDLFAEKCGELIKSTSDRVISMQVSRNKEYLIIISNPSQIEIFKVGDEEAIYKKLLKSAKKKAKKVRKAEEMENPD